MELLEKVLQTGDCAAMCEHYKKKSLQKCTKVQTLIEAIQKAGCNMKPNFFQCTGCDAQINGGFSGTAPTGPEVILCQNHLQSQEQTDRTMVHELVHAYDQCRAKMTWENCEHHACSEIRAAFISGDCDFVNEFNRGNFGFMKQHQKCVKRRAILSLQSNGNCQGEVAELAVDKVFDACYTDAAPFNSVFD